MSSVLNQQIASKLAQAGDLLEQQAANPFRVSAYRHASDTVSRLERDLGEIIEAEGSAGLISLPHIGKGIASAIQEMVATGRWGQLERWRGTLDPLHLFQTVPGIGPKMADQIHERLHIDTLEALEAAAWDGRLDSVPGIGVRRINGIRSSLAALLGKARRRTPVEPAEGPTIELLLAVDTEYRSKAEAGKLPLIAPKRFNPEGKAWLPVLHSEHGGWHFTLLFSNTARAHELHHTRDWVVVYFYDDHHEEGQCTIVTETRGPLVGKRVVRGQELECRKYYDHLSH